jgi:hypothetical protein
LLLLVVFAGMNGRESPFRWFNSGHSSRAELQKIMYGGLSSSHLADMQVISLT